MLYDELCFHEVFLVGLTLTAMLSACSDDETSDLIPEPSISISALESEIGALNFSINVEMPSNALTSA